MLSNGHVLVIKTAEGAEIRVAWVDDNGAIVKGRPLIQGVGFRLRAENMREIVTGAAAGVTGSELLKLGRAG